ncbi:hypothetical protein [Arcticibacter sp. MXS-1]|uniref:hypothetical protein n=1 Tax=Arcticibacter sp. MXS-1 TaxID=3341726 RepID=UPI0035A8F191
MKLRSSLLLIGALTLSCYTTVSADSRKSGEGLFSLIKTRTESLKNNKLPDLAAATSKIAAFYEDHGLWSASARHYREALDLQEKLGDRAGASRSVIHLAYTSLENGDDAAALRYASSAAELFSSQGRRDSAASAYVMMADLHRDLGNFQKAESLILHRALPMYRGAGNVRGRIKCFRSLGNTYRRQKRYSEAKWFFIQENMQARELRNNPGIINSLTGLASVKNDINDLDLAIADLKEAEKLAHASGNSPALADIHQVYALIYQKAGDAGNAKKYTDLASASRQRARASRNEKRSVGLEQIRETEERVLKAEAAERQIQRNVPLVKKETVLSVDAPPPAKAVSFAVVWSVITSLLILYIARAVVMRAKI